MKVLLIGNYLPDRQYSMQFYAELVKENLIKTGHQVRVIRPSAIISSLWPREDVLGKWLGYIDRFLLFPLYLLQIVPWADLVHICDQANAVYLPYLKGKMHLLTCHDMLAIRCALGEIPEVHIKVTGRIYQYWILKHLRQVRKIVCHTHQTKKELIRIAKLPMDLITVAPLSMNYPYHPMKPNKANLRLNQMGLDPNCPFILHVGGNQWYKNKRGAVCIFKELIAIPEFSHYRLVLAGTPLSRNLKKLVLNLNIEAHIIELSDITNKNLCALYSMAEALLFPSLQEGFGWPIIEAQACGCPVFTSDRPPMNQVGGNAAVYFNPKKAHAAASIISQKLKDSRSMISAGFKNTARFARVSMIEKYNDAYQMAISDEIIAI